MATPYTNFKAEWVENSRDFGVGLSAYPFSEILRFARTE
jgi:hypothetical protein